MINSVKFFCFAFSGILFILSPMAIASGGSSGSAMPSVSAPSYDPAVEYAKGIEAMKLGKFKEAEKAFDRVLSVNPKHAQTNFLAGLARAEQNNFKAARRYYEKAVKNDDSMIRAHQELAITHVKLGETEKTQSILDNLKQRATACADTCPQASDLRAAIAAIEAVITPTSETPANPTSQIQSTSDLLMASSDKGDRAYLDAVVLINEKRYEEAIVQLNRSSLVFGPHPDILTYLGFAHRKLGRFDIAEQYYRQALAAAPNHLGATEYYGELMLERGDVAGAHRMLSQLETACGFGCAQADELRRWIIAAKPKAS